MVKQVQQEVGELMTAVQQLRPKAEEQMTALALHLHKRLNNRLSEEEIHILLEIERIGHSTDLREKNLGKHHARADRSEIIITTLDRIELLNLAEVTLVQAEAKVVLPEAVTLLTRAVVAAEEEEEGSKN